MPYALVSVSDKTGIESFVGQLVQRGYDILSTGGCEQRDGNFQGFGRFMTNRKGEYYFRTIKPVPYPGRTPHIHVAVKLKGKKELVTPGCSTRSRRRRTTRFTRLRYHGSRISAITRPEPSKIAKSACCAADALHRRQA